jgi:hypothetical protein
MKISCGKTSGFWIKDKGKEGKKRAKNGGSLKKRGATWVERGASA